ncbi:hypothetical protein P5V15_001123 [Pogonomyrmex californicus]
MLAYVDDLVLLAEEEEEMRAMVARLERYIREKGLTINVGKSKMLRFGKGEGRRRRIRWYWEGREVEEILNIWDMGFREMKDRMHRLGIG